MKHLQGYIFALGNPHLRKTALKVALVVGSMLFSINHGKVLVQGKMTSDRWISGILTYLVPYGVSIHGQYMSQLQFQARERQEDKKSLLSSIK